MIKNRLLCEHFLINIGDNTLHDLTKVIFVLDYELQFFKFRSNFCFINLKFSLIYQIQTDLVDKIIRQGQKDIHSNLKLKMRMTYNGISSQLLLAEMIPLMHSILVIVTYVIFYGMP